MKWSHSHILQRVENKRLLVVLKMPILMVCYHWKSTLISIWGQEQFLGSRQEVSLACYCCGFGCKTFFGGKKSRLQVYNWFCYLGDPPPRNWDDQWYAVMIVLSPIILLICLIPLYSLSYFTWPHFHFDFFRVGCQQHWSLQGMFNSTSDLNVITGWCHAKYDTLFLEERKV